MSERDEVVYGAYWGSRCLTARDVIQLQFEILQRLRALSPLFEEWCTYYRRRRRTVTIPREYSHFEQTLLELLVRPRELYDNPDINNDKLTLDSTFPTGFAESFTTTGPGKSSISVSVFAGSHGEYSAGNHALIEIPRVHEPALTEPAFARSLMLTLVDVFSPEFTTAFTSKIMRVMDADNSLDNFGVWMHVPHWVSPDIKTPPAAIEHDVRGGTLIHLDVSSPWSDHAEELRPAFEACRAAGVLSRGKPR